MADGGGRCHNGCGGGADAALTPIAAPASVDPATATFTCPGVPEASVQAIIGYVILFPDTSTDPQDGSIRHLECRGEMYTDNAWTGTLKVIQRASWCISRKQYYDGPSP